MIQPQLHQKYCSLQKWPKSKLITYLPRLGLNSWCTWYQRSILRTLYHRQAFVPKKIEAFFCSMFGTSAPKYNKRCINFNPYCLVQISARMFVKQLHYLPYISTFAQLGNYMVGEIDFWSQIPISLAPFSFNIGCRLWTSDLRFQYVSTANLLIACLLTQHNSTSNFVFCYQRLFTILWLIFNILKFLKMIAFQLILSWLTNWGFLDYFWKSLYSSSSLKSSQFVFPSTKCQFCHANLMSTVPKS